MRRSRRLSSAFALWWFWWLAQRVPAASMALDLKKWKSDFVHAGSTLGVRSGRPLETVKGAFESLEETDRSLKAVVIGPPFRDSLAFDANATLDADGQLVVNGGFSKLVWEYLQDYTGLNLGKIVTARTWGAKNDLNGTMTGLLATSEVDVSMGNMAHCCDRYMVINYTDTLYTRSFSVVFRQPDGARDIFGSSFTPSLWTASGLMILALVLGMLFFIVVRKRIMAREEQHFCRADILSWAFCLATQQGHDQAPTHGGGRLLFLSGFTFGLICFQGYQANIISNLTSVTGIESFNDLLAYPDMKIYTSYFDPFRREVAQSQTDEGMKLWEKSYKDMKDAKAIDCKDFYKTCDKTIVDAMYYEDDSTVAFVGPEQYIHDPAVFPANENRALACELTRFRVPLGEQSLLYGTRPGLPSLRLICMGLMRLREAGLMQKYRRQTAPMPPACADFQSVFYRPASIEHVFGAYVALGAVYVVALLLTAAEFAAHAWKRTWGDAKAKKLSKAESERQIEMFWMDTARKIA